MRVRVWVDVSLVQPVLLLTHSLQFVGQHESALGHTHEQRVSLSDLTMWCGVRTIKVQGTVSQSRNSLRLESWLDEQGQQVCVNTHYYTHSHVHTEQDTAPERHWECGENNPSRSFKITLLCVCVIYTSHNAAPHTLDLDFELYLSLPPLFLTPSLPTPSSLSLCFLVSFSCYTARHRELPDLSTHYIYCVTLS